MNRKEESNIQANIFRAIQVYSKKDPRLKFAFSTLNGVKLTIGQAVKAKRTGNKRGVPDIVFPFPTKDKKYAGLFLELKTEKGRPSKEQLEYISFLNDQGFKAIICYGFKEAHAAILEYINS